MRVHFEFIVDPAKPWSADGFLALNGRKIPLVLVRNRRARRYVLRMRPDGSARVTIPRGGSTLDARRFVERNGDWFERQLQRLAARPSRPREWRTGTEILFRGQWVRIEPGVESEGFSPPESPPLLSPVRSGEVATQTDLFISMLQRSPMQEHPELVSGGNADSFAHRFRKCDPHRNGCPQSERGAVVRFATETVNVTAITADLRPAIERHLWRMAAKELPPRVHAYAALHELRVDRVTVRNQRSRWGSCSRRGTISLNWRLIQAPQHVQDYILLHELCHLRQMNHSAKYWAEVERVCPDFRIAECWLKQHSSLLR